MHVRLHTEIFYVLDTSELDLSIYCMFLDPGLMCVVNVNITHQTVPFLPWALRRVALSHLLEPRSGPVTCLSQPDVSQVRCYFGEGVLRASTQPSSLSSHCYGMEGAHINTKPLSLVPE